MTEVDPKAARAQAIRRRMREARIRLGLTQKQAAQRAGLTIRTIYSLEVESRVLPRASTLAALSRAYGVSMDWLWFGDDDGKN